MSALRRLVVVSNRLPITIGSTGKENFIVPSAGGLVSALEPILKSSGGCWIGWPGTECEASTADPIAHWCSKQGYSLIPISLTLSEQAQYYRQFSNGIIWPLFHGLLRCSRFDLATWRSYCTVNDKFAGAVDNIAVPGDFIWVHDYHLMMCADALRRRGLQQRIIYFHHIPFPSPDIFETLPCRFELLWGLLKFDVLGFQTARDRQNFISCLNRFLPTVRLRRSANTSIARVGGRETRIGSYPISIDRESFSAVAREPAVARAAATLRSRLGPRIMLGVDRLDYTKGIPSRLLAFERLLERHRDLCGEVTLVQILVPSRTDIREYQELHQQIESLVRRINGAYAVPGWMPIKYFYRSFSRNELITFYRAADIAVVTPLKDGMNLVAKEFCASRVDETGVLILSQFAGAAEELKCGAILVNPHDIDGIVSAMGEALQMEVAEQRYRMRTMQSQIRSHDVFDWCRSLVALPVEHRQIRRFHFADSRTA